MRKALITLLAAATVLTPAAALAQRGGRGPAVEDGSGERMERFQRRQAQREQRQERQQQEAQPQPQPQVQEQQVARNERRGGGDGNRGGERNRDGDNQRGGDRNWRGNDGQNDGNRNWRGGDRRGPQQPSIYPQAWQGDPNDPRLQRYRQRELENQQRYGRDGRRGDRDNDGRNWRDRDGDGRNWRGDNDRRRWDRNWRSDRRYDWRNWRNSNRNIFRGSRYYSPYRNWGYNRFSIGIFLEPLFYGRNYWISDPWQYRLPHAYPGTQWVRYYNDVLLVDVYTGEVIDVIHDFFW